MPHSISAPPAELATGQLLVAWCWTGNFILLPPEKVFHPNFFYKINNSPTNKKYKKKLFVTKQNLYNICCHHTTSFFLQKNVIVFFFKKKVFCNKQKNTVSTKADLLKKHFCSWIFFFTFFVGLVSHKTSFTRKLDKKFFFSYKTLIYVLQ